jgi:hypothetical protein
MNPYWFSCTTFIAEVCTLLARSLEISLGPAFMMEMGLTSLTFSVIHLRNQGNERMIKCSSNQPDYGRSHHNACRNHS